MPQSKTHSSRAKKLAKRRADQQRRAVPQTYVVMLDQLRAVLNKRFYEEQGFPHLEILAERYKGPVTTGHLSNYFELQHFFIGMGAAMANALSPERKFSKTSAMCRAGRARGRSKSSAAAGASPRWPTPALPTRRSLWTTAAWPATSAWTL